MKLRTASLLVGLAVLAATLSGWWTFAFLTDDAFATFRYAANLLDGHGLVWNPAPFQPVEGYPSFLWVVLLAGVWQLTGIAPPSAANVLSLALGLGTLVLLWRLLGRMRLPARVENHRLLLAGAALLAVATHRTFLTWLSSGLETSLFLFCFTGWVVLALTAPEQRGRRWGLVLSLAAAASALARGDGWIAVIATPLLLADDVRRREGGSPRRAAQAALPLLIVAVHLVWRRATYGAWLSNALPMQGGPWPESGIRYAASFAVEYGLWFWAALVVAWGAVALPDARGRLGSLISENAHVVIAVAAVVAPVVYVTLIVGGDPLEYRVYAQLAPLIPLSVIWLAVRVAGRARGAWILVGVFALVSLPIPWAHRAATSDLTTLRETRALAVPLAGHFPWPARPVVEAWDGWQEWLIRRRVGLRQQELAVFCRTKQRTLPSRAEGARIRWEERAVIASPAAGVLGWVLPHVAVIDMVGPNDPVISRTAPVVTGARLAAHARRPPPGYVQCYQPNVELREGLVDVRPRPMPDEAIRSCETRAWTPDVAADG